MNNMDNNKEGQKGNLEVNKGPKETNNEPKEAKNESKEVKKEETGDKPKPSKLNAYGQPMGQKPKFTGPRSFNGPKSFNGPRQNNGPSFNNGPRPFNSGGPRPFNSGPRPFNSGSKPGDQSGRPAQGVPGQTQEGVANSQYVPGQYRGNNNKSRPQRASSISPKFGPSGTTAPRSGGDNQSRGGYNKGPSSNYSHGNRSGGDSRKNSKYQNVTYQKTIFTRKVTKAVKGGRNMSFCSITVVGNQQGFVGIGVGKSRKISNAIDKSLENAKNNMITPIRIIPMKYVRCATEIIIKLRKNDILRTPSYISEIFEAAGYKNVSCKLIRSKNVMNAIFCIFDALKYMNELNKIQAQVNGSQNQNHGSQNQNQNQSS